MPGKATINNDLTNIDLCVISTPNGDIKLKSLPEITEGKTSHYSDQPIQGRAAPVKTYSYGENRHISMTIHLYVMKESDIIDNINTIRLISALAHPEYNNTYLPPHICHIKCGPIGAATDLASIKTNGVPVVLNSYSINYDPSITWMSDGNYMIPIHVAMTTEWDVAYSYTSLPGHSDVISGRY